MCAAKRFPWSSSINCLSRRRTTRCLPPVWTRSERVQTGGKHRVVRRRERQFIDDDQGKRFAAHIHPFPKTLTADQNGVARLLEAFQQFSTAGVALYQQRKIPVARMQSLAQLGRKPFNRA